MTPEQAAELAERILELIPAEDRLGGLRHHHHNRKRVATDLAGVQRHRSYSDELGEDYPAECSACSYDDRRVEWPCVESRTYARNLRRTARLYGARE